MNDIVLNYIIQAILGGASGYITNDYAINMLFKEYTPLKIGGVIKKTRGEFIENLSSMVENDIINKDKLQEILSDENFKIKFENLTADFYNNCIDETAGDDTWDKIITDDTDKFIRNLIIEYSPKVFELLIKDFDIKEFLNDNQLNSISSFFHDAILEIFENNRDITKNVLLSIYNNNLNLTLDNIIDKKSPQQIVSNMVNALKDNIIKCDNFELQKALNITGVEKAVEESVNILLNKQVHEVINISSEIIVKVDDKVLSYINSDKGYRFIFNLCTSLFTHGKSINKTISELLDNNFEENLKHYLIETIPGITEKIVNWIKENNHTIDKLLEDSIDEVINESDGLKAKLLSTIKNTYLSNLSKKYSIVDKIVAYVESNTEPEKLSIFLSAKILDMMNNLTIREFIEEAEINGLTPHKCTELIIAYLNNNFTKILKQSVEFIKDIKINNLFPASSPNDESVDKAIIKFKEICSSQNVQDFFTEKLSLYTDNILSAKLENLLSEEKINNLSLNFNNFIVQELNNKYIIKKWICAQIDNITENLDISLNNETISFLNEELYKEYEAYSKDLRNTKLSPAIDKLKSIDNIANNSSDYLRSYAIKNTDTILKGSIKLIVTDNLNKLNDDELVDLANDFIGRELKPIMFFGGALGVIAGLILAAFQNKALNPQEISFANMILYAFVGFITNVIAINMIFKPYKENKLISKIPFFRNFSLGYIVKNQKIFAEKTSYFIDNNLLSKKSISNLFEKHEEKIKSSFIKTAADNDYKILKDLLSNSKINIVNKVFLFSKNKIKNDLNRLCSFLYIKISKIKIFSVIDNVFKNYCHSFINSENISKGIYSFLNSKRNIRGNFINNFVSKFIDNFSEYNLKDNLYKFEEEYKQLNSKKINEILDRNQLKNIEEFTAKKINSILLSQNIRNKMFQNASLLLNKSIDKDNTIGEIFDGKLKNYIDSHLPDLTESIINMLNKSIQSNKPKVTLMVQSEIKNQLGFIEKGMYTLMGGDEIIDELLSKIITVKVPAYLELKKNELNNIISITTDEKLYKAKAEILFSIVNKLKIKELIDNYVSEKSEKIENIIKTKTSSLVNNSDNIEIGNILNVFYLNNIQTAYNVYGAELDTFTTLISENIKENKNDIINSLTEFNKISHNDIFKEIKYEDVESSVNNLINQLNKNSNIEKIIDEFINFFVSNNEDATIEQILNEDEFIASLRNYISRLIESSENEKVLKDIFIKTIDTAVSHNLNFISNDSKDYLFNIFIDSTINSLKRNLDKILKSVEFDKIAKEEIEKMKPQKIHKMFNSFGEKYFRRLMIYGFGGFIFGINVYIGMSLTALKVSSQLMNKN
ncbi:DUF445 family protein [Sedimentibacter sp.]|uniref:DUF445 family protein n=1 Tax=Sedimentibacter sp. TaxID=1960295 RepID=UPI0028AF347D|nr:DUF445 family protein [Sedimentibacter sp.]